ncbi:hypothetical protein Tco_1265740 [Tanacetum coccineum]
MLTWKWLQSIIGKLQLKREERENLQLPSNSSQSLLKRSQAPASKPKVTREKPVKPSPEKHPKRGKVQIIRKGKSSLQLIDEEEPSQPEPIHQGEGKEYDVERAIPESPGIVLGTGIRVKSIATEEASCKYTIGSAHPKRRSTIGPILYSMSNSATKEASTGPSTQPHDDASANIVRDSPSPADAETGADTDKTNSGGDTEILQIGEEQEEDVDNQVNLEEYTAELDQGQAGSDPEDPLSFSETLSLMKNLNDAYTIRDPFLNDKSTEDEPRKLIVDSEAVSLVTVLIYQAFSLVPPLSTPVIDLSPLNKHLPPAPFFERTTTTTTKTLPPPPQQQSTTDSESRELPEADMKEILHQRMFEIGTYKSLPEHVALYEALEASIERANREEFLAEKDKSRKR